MLEMRCSSYFNCVIEYVKPAWQTLLQLCGGL